MNWRALAVAHIFEQIADLSEISGTQPYKSHAYRRAARNIRRAGDRFDALLETDELETIPGVGPALAGKAREIARTGRCEYLDRLSSEIPPSVLDLLGVQGLGLKTVASIYRQLRVSTLAELEEAARAGKLRRISGLGARRERTIIESIQKMKQHSGLTLDWADAIAGSLCEALSGERGIEVAFPVGQLRRRTELVTRLEVMAALESGLSWRDLALENMLWVREARAGSGEEGLLWPHLEVILESDAVCRVHCVPEESAGVAAIQLTGSGDHLERLARLGYRTDDVPGGGSEEQVYEWLGLPHIAPVLREDGDEVDAALAAELPRLVEVGDIRGDLHCHTTYSDGDASVEDMVVAAEQRGLQYLAITDHSHSLPVVQGLDAAGLAEQAEEIRMVRRRHPEFCLLHGIETEIGADGSVDLPDEVLKDLDVVIAAVHTGLNGSSAEMTARLVRAAAHPHVDVIAHPTGRLLGARHPEMPDLQRLLQVCKGNGVAVEINASPDRLDLPWRWVRRARQMGVPLVVNSDAHSPGGLGLMRYGVDCAGKGWCGKGDILNCLPPSGIRQWLTSRVRREVR